MSVKPLSPLNPKYQSERAASGAPEYSKITAENNSQTPESIFKKRALRDWYVKKFNTPEKLYDQLAKTLAKGDIDEFQLLFSSSLIHTIKLLPENNDPSIYSLAMQAIQNECYGIAYIICKK